VATLSAMIETARDRADEGAAELYRGKIWSKYSLPSGRSGLVGSKHCRKKKAVVTSCGLECSCGGSVDGLVDARLLWRAKTALLSSLKTIPLESRYPGHICPRMMHFLHAGLALSHPTRRSLHAWQPALGPRFTIVSRLVDPLAIGHVSGSAVSAGLDRLCLILDGM
jgi:hypothetical protein